ncbi:MAG: ImmA/IrrE family metallo-endopeptidase [Anaerolineae bacterium]
MNIEHLEKIVEDLCENFEVYAPPVPVELMLRQPRDGMWEEVDIAQMSGSFRRISERYSPRMTIARLLVRHIMVSEWGKQYELATIKRDENMINAFARMILMPRDMVLGLTSSMRTPTLLSDHFEIPESDAEIRLLELN